MADIYDDCIGIEAIVIHSTAPMTCSAVFVVGHRELTHNPHPAPSRYVLHPIGIQRRAQVGSNILTDATNPTAIMP